MEWDLRDRGRRRVSQRLADAPDHIDFLPILDGSSYFLRASGVPLPGAPRNAAGRQLRRGYFIGDVTGVDKVR